MFYERVYDSPAGPLYIYTDDTTVLEVEFYEASDKPLYAKEGLQRDHLPPIMFQTIHWLDRYFEGSMPDPSELSLAPKGTPFQRFVWETLLEIPYGQLTTYGRISEKAAAYFGKARMSAQAVGQAVGHNPIGIIIPCHRVIGKNHSLTGYGGGLDKKIWLLSHEKIDIQTLSMPKQEALTVRRRMQNQ